MIKAWAMAACLAMAALAAAGAATAQQGFTPQQAATFSSECAASGAQATLCQCVWDRIQAGMTAEEYVALDTAVRSQQLHPSMAKYELMVGECNGTSRVTASNPQAYPGHTSSNFMNSCIQGGVSQAVCACSMNEVERAFSLQTFTELDRMMSWNRGQEHPAYPQFVQIVQTCFQQNP